jgi:hypothetical protein
MGTMDWIELNEKYMWILVNKKMLDRGIQQSIGVIGRNSTHKFVCRVVAMHKHQGRDGSQNKLLVNMYP